MSGGIETQADIARVADGLRSEFRRKVNTLRGQVDDEIRQLRRTADQRAKEVGTRLDLADERLGRIADAHDELRRQTDGELRGARQAIARLTGEIHLIEARLRLEHGVRPIDLDGIPAELEQLVAQVRAAEDIRATILDDDSRTGYDRWVSAYAELEHAAAETRGRALDASRALAAERAGGRAFRRAAAAYRRERDRLRAQTEELRATRAGCEAARAALAEDALRQETYLAHRGASAVDDLAAYVRERVDAAVAAHALFPAWFTITELGHRPPSGRATAWRDAAVQVVLYRIAYAVTHSVLALGEPPAAGHRAERHAAVLAALHQLED
jgi:chromosome segregation ATPase